MKRLILFTIASVLVLSVGAQDSTRNRRMTKAERKEVNRQRINALVKQEEEGALIYNKQSVFGVGLRTNGYGIFYELGKMKTRRKTTLYTAELTEIKDPKEEKFPAGAFPIGNPFIFGKINNFYQFKLGFGQQYLFGQKGNKNGVAVTGNVVGGFSLGLLRPYYLEIEDSTGNPKKIKFNPEDTSEFINSPIRGSGGIGKGWGEMKMKPGAYIKGTMRFDWGKYNEMVYGIEIGLSVEFYSQKIPILLYAKERQLFFQGHIALVFGKRK